MRHKEKELISEIAGGQGQSKNLSARLQALDEQLVRQSELMYSVDLNIQVRGSSLHVLALQKKDILVLRVLLIIVF